jgi:hypothetical protein
VTRPTLVIHLFADGLSPTTPDFLIARIRWQEVIERARRNHSRIIHITQHWPLQSAPNTSIEILACESVFQGARRSVLDCHGIASEIQFKNYRSFALIGICTTEFARNSLAVIGKRYAGRHILNDTVDCDQEARGKNWTQLKTEFLQDALPYSPSKR